MLKTLIVGAAVAFMGVKLKKAYDSGKLDPYISRAKAAAEEARRKAASAREQASVADADNPSKPARATPWPIDNRAMPSPG